MKKFQQELLAEESDNSKQKKFDPPKDENICPGFFFFLFGWIYSSCCSVEKNYMHAVNTKSLVELIDHWVGPGYHRDIISVLCITCSHLHIKNFQPPEQQQQFTGKKFHWTTTTTAARKTKLNLFNFICICCCKFKISCMDFFCF